MGRDFEKELARGPVPDVNFVVLAAADDQIVISAAKFSLDLKGLEDMTSI